MKPKTKHKERISSTYAKRVQTVLTEEQYEMLLRIAKEEGKPISVLIRKAIEEEYFKKTLLAQRKKALKSLLSLGAPVADWDEMEAQIIKGAMDE
ncbi:hypothetical protein MYX76_16415 [Desulfobacterota bacterium AH_259_B03_O07]|nr:hypothetical protein [Desulfobacterota bacterium AH_259_B03_O07]